MNFNLIKSIVFVCLLLLLNSCGIGRYHSLNLVRPDKKTTTALVKPKHMDKIVTEVFKVDSSIVEITKENASIKTANTISEKKETLTIPFLEKPSQNAKKVKVRLKEKSVETSFKISKIIAKSNKEQNKWKPNFNIGDFYFEIFILILLLSSFVIGLLVLPFNFVVGLWMIGVPLAIVLLIALYIQIFFHWLK
ncbi:MAG: hypothetical protein ACEQSR_14385 [Candidatus Methylacidiphilales bacterium]